MILLKGMVLVFDVLFLYFFFWAATAGRTLSKMSYLLPRDASTNLVQIHLKYVNGTIGSMIAAVLATESMAQIDRHFYASMHAQHIPDSLYYPHVAMAVAFACVLLLMRFVFSGKKNKRVHALLFKLVILLAVPVLSSGIVFLYLF